MVTLWRICIAVVLVVSASCRSGSERAVETASEGSEATPPSSTETGDSAGVERDDSPIGEPLADDTTLRPGERRLAPLYLHCGISPQIRFNERTWDLSDTPLGPVPETGAGDEVPADWPRTDNGHVARYIGLGDDDAIRFSLTDGRVIAVYRPSSKPYKRLSCA